MNDHNTFMEQILSKTDKKVAIYVPAPKSTTLDLQTSKTGKVPINPFSPRSAAAKEGSIQRPYHSKDLNLATKRINSASNASTNASSAKKSTKGKTPQKSRPTSSMSSQNTHNDRKFSLLEK